MRIYRKPLEYLTFELSVQASSAHECDPKTTGLPINRYYSVDVCCISRVEADRWLLPSDIKVNGFDQHFTLFRGEPKAYYAPFMPYLAFEKFRDAIDAEWAIEPLTEDELTHYEHIIYDFHHRRPQKQEKTAIAYMGYLTVGIPFKRINIMMNRNRESIRVAKSSHSVATKDSLTIREMRERVKAALGFCPFNEARRRAKGV